MNTESPRRARPAGLQPLLRGLRATLDRLDAVAAELIAEDASNVDDLRDWAERLLQAKPGQVGAVVDPAVNLRAALLSLPAHPEAAAVVARLRADLAVDPRLLEHRNHVRGRFVAALPESFRAAVDHDRPQVATFAEALRRALAE